MTHRRHLNAALPCKVLPRKGFLARHHLFWRASADNLAAIPPSPRPQIHKEVRRAHGVQVMLDDDDGVAEVTQSAEGVQQLVVVALMEADAGFVQDVEHADQTAAHLARQADALRFAPRERT